MVKDDLESEILNLVAKGKLSPDEAKKLLERARGKTEQREYNKGLEGGQPQLQQKPVRRTWPFWLIGFALAGVIGYNVINKYRNNNESSSAGYTPYNQFYEQPSQEQTSQQREPEKSPKERRLEELINLEGIRWVYKTSDAYLFSDDTFLVEESPSGTYINLNMDKKSGAGWERINEIDIPFPNWDYARFEGASGKILVYNTDKFERSELHDCWSSTSWDWTFYLIPVGWPEQKQETYQQPEQTREEQEQGPRVYGMGEWVSSGDLEWKVNEVYQKRICQYEQWIAAGLTTDNMSDEEITAMKTRYYSDFAVVNITAKSASDNINRISLSSFKLYYPYECRAFIESAILNVLNGSKETTREVGKYTSSTFSIPFLLYTTLDASGQQYAPKGIVRIGIDEKNLVEIQF